MMDKLMEEVNECTKREYARAGARYGFVNNSDHESYAVLLEEFEEASAELGNISSQIAAWWDLIKCNGSDPEKYIHLQHMKISAVLAACECIQVAAMAHKAMRTLEERRNE